MGELKEPIIELIYPSELTLEDIALLNFHKTTINNFVIFRRRNNHVMINAKHEKAAELRELVKEIIICDREKQETKALLDHFDKLTGERACIILGHIRYFLKREYNEEKLIDFFSQENTEKEIVSTLHDLDYKTSKLPQEIIKFLGHEKKIGFIYGYIMGLKAAEQGKRC